MQKQSFCSLKINFLLPRSVPHHLFMINQLANSHMNRAFIAPLPINYKTDRRPTGLEHRRTPRCVETPPRAPAFNPHTSALREGIKAVAIGKHGTKPVPHDLFPDLSRELSTPNPPRALLLQRASFIASLFVKQELLPMEHALLYRFTHSAAHVSGRERISGDAKISSGEILAAVSTLGSELDEYAKRMLDGERLTTEEAYEVGRLLYAKGGDECVKALVAHIMRVRHETSEEMGGLCLAASRGVSRKFTRLRGTDNGTYVHIAEPFDGTITYDLMTPILSNHLVKKGLKPVMAVGRSSGPKFGPNLADVAKELGIRACRDVDEVLEELGKGGLYGCVVDQTEAHEGMSEWVELRRIIVKRPAIATAEKFVDACPERAKVFIGSAFHTAYIEKMGDACEAVGYESYIIIGRGMEGSLGLGVSSKRKALLLVGWERDGGYSRELLEYSAWDAGLACEDAVVKGGLTAAGSSARIRRFVESGSAGCDMFDQRARATLAGFDLAVDLLKRERAL